MTINLNLTGDRYVPHHTVVTAPENVELSFKSSCYVLSEIIVDVVDQDGHARYKSHGDPVDISRHTQRAGEVFLSCSLIARGEVLTSWQIESLLVKETPSGLIVISELEYFKARMDVLEQALLELAKK